MSFSKVIIATAILWAGSSVAGEDLYRVKIASTQDATRLRLCGVEGLVRLPDGFLVLANSDAANGLAQSGLDAELVASDVSRDQLRLERSRGAAATDNRRVLFAENNVQISRRPDGAAASSFEVGMIPLTDPVPIEFRQSRVTAEKMIARLPELTVPLDSLIGLISKDSLISYLRYLEALPSRVVGSASMRQTRDWLVNRLQAYEIDSVAVDSFTVLTGTGPQTCWNVIGYKFGTRFPNHRIVLGAHPDAVANCPGADDDGSGTVALIEIARALSGIETDMTIVLGFFDGEEAGLWGSKYYAHQCKARGDSVVYMMEPDMIGEITNTDIVRLYADPPLDCSQLFASLAESLVNLITIIDPMLICDAYPWGQGGYEAVFVEEYLFSPQYHQTNDNTSYINFDYMTRITKAILATAYAVSGTAWPEPTLAFSFPDGVPENVMFTRPRSFDVSISSVNEGVIVPGSEKLVYRVEDGIRQEAPLTSLGSGTYRATLPALNCGERIFFWVQSDEATNGPVFDRDTIWPHMAFGASGAEKIFEDNFETDRGWTVVSQCYQNAGRWERGMPAGAGFRAEAVLDFDNSGQCYQTGNRFYQQFHWVTSGYTTLTSPSLDLQGADGIIHLAILYSNGTNNASHSYTPHSDTLIVMVRENSTAPWVYALRLGPVYRADGGWFEYSFRVGDFVTPSSDVRVMIVAEDVGAISIVDAAVDDVWVAKYECNAQALCCLGATGNVDCDPEDGVDISDLTALIDNLYISFTPLCCQWEANVDGSADGNIDISDLSVLIDHLYITFTPTAECE